MITFVINMKHVSKQIMAVLMAFVVLCTTMSFTVNMHYCGDTLVDYALVQKAKSCGMELSIPNENAGCDLQIVKKSCCQDKSVTAKGHDDLKPSFTSIDLEQQVFITSFFYSYAALFTPQTVTPKAYTNYTPPLLVRDVQTLDEVYLI